MTFHHDPALNAWP